MAKLHIFNPEHDIALAANLVRFTAPHAGRQLRADLGFLPALWASEGDFVLVDHTDYACRQLRRICSRLGEPSRGRGVTFVERGALSSLPVEAVDPWGWDAALCHQLAQWGIHSSLLLSSVQLDTVRQLSHRRHTVPLSHALQGEGFCGGASELFSEEDVRAFLSAHPSGTVLKAPWSSSGRGVRFVASSLTPSLEGWLRNVILRQGSVMCEPLYHRVKDFGMEFFSDGEGRVSYLGLSLFHTSNGAYQGNLLATEPAKERMLSALVPANVQHRLRDGISETLGALYKGHYRGPLGVDLMVTSQGVALAEINLRRTMGHVALALSSQGDDEVRRVMRIVSEDQYKLKIQKQ